MADTRINPAPLLAALGSRSELGALPLVDAMLPVFSMADWSSSMLPIGRASVMGGYTAGAVGTHSFFAFKAASPAGTVFSIVDLIGLGECYVLPNPGPGTVIPAGTALIPNRIATDPSGAIGWFNNNAAALYTLDRQFHVNATHPFAKRIPDLWIQEEDFLIVETLGVNTVLTCSVVARDVLVSRP